MLLPITVKASETEGNEEGRMPGGMNFGGSMPMGGMNMQGGGMPGGNFGGGRQNR